MDKLETIDNYYILAFAYRVYNAKWVKECLILENNANDVIANEREEMLSRICFQLMFAMDSYYEKGLINLTAISEYDIYKSAYSYTLGLIKRKSSSLIWTKSALENFASELHEKIIALENLLHYSTKKTAFHNSGKPFFTYWSE